MADEKSTSKEEPKADPKPEAGEGAVAPEELSKEEFAALREQVRKMYDQGPEETR